MTHTPPTHDHYQPNLRSMSSPLEFWDTVRLECERADRYDMRLFMAVYEIGIKDEKNILVKTLVRKLSLRVRNMDFIGWFSTGQIGILIPHTPNEGAIKLAQDIYDLLSPLTSPPPFTIYTYPSDRWPIKKSIPLRLLKIFNNVKIWINPQGITQSDELRAQLGLELDRANRYGHSFALIVFHCSNVAAHGITVSKLAKALNHRLRETDSFGWYGSNEMAAILPYATLSNATQIGQSICDIAGIPAPGSFTAYSYPHQWLATKSTPSTAVSQPENIPPATLPGDTQTQEQLPPSLLRGDQFKRALDKEIMRALLNGHDLSLLIFNANNLTGQESSVSTFAHNLSNRLREVDQFGWYEEGKIGVLLPSASHDAAIKLGQSICELNHLSAEGMVTVYTYPSHWTPDHPSPSPPKNNRPLTKAADFDCRQGDALATPPSEIEDFIAKPIPTWKRALDVSVSLCGIILLSPLFLLVAIGIRKSSRGPIFFRQTRIGYKRKPFTLLKFRSMHAHADAEKHRKFMKRLITTNADTPNTKIETDERIFPLGLFLRKTSIDELPQLFNVLKGEMSLVGPRPCLDYEADEYLQWHTQRFHILPGITGLWQVSGKNRLSFKQMIRLDIQYAKKLSFWRDVSILVKTIPAMISIYFERHT